MRDSATGQKGIFDVPATMEAAAINEFGPPRMQIQWINSGSTQTTDFAEVSYLPLNAPAGEPCVMPTPDAY
jgi:hypothetical protein